MLASLVWGEGASTSFPRISCVFEWINLPVCPLTWLWSDGSNGRPFRRYRRNRRNDNDKANSSKDRGTRPAIRRPDRPNRRSSKCGRSAFWIRIILSARPRNYSPCNRNCRPFGRRYCPLSWSCPCSIIRNHLSYCCSSRTWNGESNLSFFNVRSSTGSSLESRGLFAVHL